MENNIHYIISVVLTVCFGIFGWLFRSVYNNLNTRLTKAESYVDNINLLKTEIAVLKQKLEDQDQINEKIDQIIKLLK